MSMHNKKKQAEHAERQKRLKAHRERMQQKKEEEARRHKERAAQPEVPSTPTTEKPPSAGERHAQEEAEEQAWKEFEQGDLDTKIARFDSMLPEPGWADSPDALEMADMIFHQALNQGDYERVYAFEHHLKDASPEFIKAFRVYVLDECIRASLLSGNDERLNAYALEMAEHAEESADVFADTLYPLIYHGRLDTLQKMLHVAVPRFQDDEDVTPWGVHEFVSWGMYCELFLAYERGFGEPPDYDGLMQRTNYYSDTNREWLVSYVDALRAAAPRTWKLEDFVMSPAPKEKGRKKKHPVEPGADNLTDLSYEFVGWMRRERSIPLIRGEFMRQELTGYLIERAHRTIDLDRRSLIEKFLKTPRKKLVAPKPVHPLCPDRESFDAFSADEFGSFIKSRPYHIAALFLSVPYWLKFLERRNLLSPETAARALDEVAYLQEVYVKMGEKQVRDPLLTQDLRNWGRLE